jgi:hypothetical protein
LASISVFNRILEHLSRAEYSATAQASEDEKARAGVQPPVAVTNPTLEKKE